MLNFSQMNQSRRETDETAAELRETRKDNERLREDGHLELEKASLSEYSVLSSICNSVPGLATVV